MLQARRRSLPPLNALRFFEAAARHESFARAADELCVTPGAVSRQVKALETSLGVKLFERYPQALKIAPAGKSLLITVRGALDVIQRGTRELEPAQREVKIGVSPNFGVRWLSSRLHEFRAQHPTTSVVIEASPELTDLSTGDLDLVVRFGDGNWQGVISDQLFPSGMVAVVSPKLLLGRSFVSAKQWSKLPLIHIESTNAWSEWFEAADLRSVSQQPPIIVSHTYLAIEAALNGAGVAFVHPALVARELSRGQLCLVPLSAVDSGKSYWLARPHDRRPSSSAKKLMNWLRKCTRQRWVKNKRNVATLTTDGLDLQAVGH
jgi:LysR family transcriptional regulator, glycine cleavage system transcriptional activator